MRFPGISSEFVFSDVHPKILPGMLSKNNPLIYLKDFARNVPINPSVFFFSEFD